MPRKAKEKNDELNITKIEKTIDSKKDVVKSRTTSTKTKSTTTKSSKEKSTSSAKTTKKNVTEKKTKSKTKSNTKSKTKTANTIVEYYDLPFRYNQTVVKILAQTPNTLFIYWDISDEDKKSYIEKYGESFFESTRPYLIITNETMHYTFEVEINDFANSWYLHINDASCEYKVELSRKFIINSSNNNLDNTSLYSINDYVSIAFSNEIETPNNHILFDQLSNSVLFRNTKTNIIEEKNIASISFLQKIGKVYHIYDLYQQMYHDELISNECGINLPSSNSSSSFK